MAVSSAARLLNRTQQHRDPHMPRCRDEKAPTGSSILSESRFAQEKTTRPPPNLKAGDQAPGPWRNHRKPAVTAHQTGKDAV